MIRPNYYFLNKHSQNIARLRIVVGEHSIKEASGLEQISAVSSFTMHENYSSTTYENDISLIFVNLHISIGSGSLIKYCIYIHSFNVLIFQVTTPFDLSVASAKPVNLPPPTSDFDPSAGTIITVSGWGTTSVRILLT